MATQFASLTGFLQPKSKKYVPSGRHENVHYQHSGRHIKLECHDLEEQNDEDGMGKKYKLQRKKIGHWGQELPRLGFRYMTSSIRYILRKAKAFYNECCCHSLEDPNPVVGKEVLLVDPYFSIPAVPPPTIAPTM